DGPRESERDRGAVFFERMKEERPGPASTHARRRHAREGAAELPARRSCEVGRKEVRTRARRKRARQAEEHAEHTANGQRNLERPQSEGAKRRGLPLHELTHGSRQLLRSEARGGAPRVQARDHVQPEATAPRRGAESARQLQPPRTTFQLPHCSEPTQGCPEQAR